MSIISNRFLWSTIKWRWNCINSITPRYVADINGDGYADLIAFKEDGVYVSFTKFVCSHVSRDPNNKCNCYPGYEDLGDGKECYK